MCDLPADPRYREARRRVRNLRGFYTHALAFAAVNAGLLVVDLATSRGGPWLGWATLGWAFGLLMHGVSVFVCGGWLGPEWEARKVREYLERHRGAPR